MPSLLKQQILKPLSIFAKNLNPNQIKLSALKGEVDMEYLELDENVFMELLEIPTWLIIRKATCSRVSIKIPWTHLKSQPILVMLECVTAQLEILQTPRTVQPHTTPSYRTSTGKYSFVDKVIDVLSLRVNELRLELSSTTFQSSIQLSHIVMKSKKPNWESGPLSSTFIESFEHNAVLLFKEIMWESTRFEANGLIDQVHTTPVKIITNGARLRLTLKKKLSDSSLVCGRFVLLLENLLWILSISQVEATICFLKSVKECVNLSAQQDFNRVTEKMKKILSGSFAGVTSSSTMVPKEISLDLPVTQRSINPLFNPHNIKENSFHLHVDLIETHFCEDTFRVTPLSTQISTNGSVRMTLNNLNFDHYPLHLKANSKQGLRSCVDHFRSRDQWLASLNDACNPESLCRQFESSHAHGLIRANSLSSSTSSLAATMASIDPVYCSVFESVTVFRLGDFTVTCVMLDDDNADEREAGGSDRSFLLSKRGHSDRNKSRLDAEQTSLFSNSFMSSDLRMHKLSSKIDVVAVSLTQYFTLANVNQDLPMVLFAQVNPFHIRFDVDTLIWLNAFLLNLTLNLQSLFRDHETEAIRDAPPPSLFFRAEALMPRVIFPLHPGKNAGQRYGTYPWVGPSALVLQVDTAIIQSTPSPLATTVADSLRCLVDDVTSVADSGAHTLNSDRYDHPLIAWSRFRRFIDSREGDKTSPTAESGHTIHELLACIHVPSLWADFLTVCEAASTRGRDVVYKTYRQVFLDPVPLTAWVAGRWPIRFRAPGTPRYPVVWQRDLALAASQLPEPPHFPEPISLLITLDSNVNPLCLFPSLASIRSPAQPVRLMLGHSGAVFTFRAAQLLRLPDVVDHLAFLFGLLHRLLNLQSSLTLDWAKIGNAATANVFHEWLVIGKLICRRGLQLQFETSEDSRLLYPLDEDASDLLGDDYGESVFQNLEPQKPLALASEVNLTAAESTSDPNLASANVDAHFVFAPALKNWALTTVASESMIEIANNACINQANSAGNLSSPNLKNTVAQLSPAFSSGLVGSKELENLLSNGSARVGSAEGSHHFGSHLVKLSSSASCSSLDESFSILGPNEPVDDAFNFDEAMEADQHRGFVVFGGSFVEGVPLLEESVLDDPVEVGSEAIISDSDDNPVTVQDEEQAISFPPWKFSKITVRVDNPTCDFDLSTVELRAWIGLGEIGILNHDQPSETNSEPPSVVGFHSTYLFSLRLGGRSLPNMPASLLHEGYNGWASIRLDLLREATLRVPASATGTHLANIVHHLTIRGGFKALRDVVTSGRDAGPAGLQNPPELIDVSFMLSSGDFHLEFYPTETEQNTFLETLKKVTLRNGISAKLSTDGNLEILGNINNALFDTSPTTITPTMSPMTRPQRITPKRPPPPAYFRRNDSITRSGSDLTDTRVGDDAYPALLRENAELKKTIESLKCEVARLSNDLVLARYDHGSRSAGQSTLPPDI